LSCDNSAVQDGANWVIQPGTTVCEYEATPDFALTLPDDMTNKVTMTYISLDLAPDTFETDLISFTNAGNPTDDSVDLTDTALISVGTPNPGDWDYSDPSGTVSTAGSINYSGEYSCSTDRNDYDVNGQYTTTHSNTATIANSDVNEASETVVKTVNCAIPDIQKTAPATYDLEWTWTIDKDSDRSDNATDMGELTLSSSQMLTVNYTATVNASSAPVNIGLTGTIDITNTSGSRDLDIVSLVDVLPDAVDLTVTCPDTYKSDDAGLEYSIPHSTTMQCEYTAGLPNLNPRNNTATMTQQLYNFASDGTPSDGGEAVYDDVEAVGYTQVDDIDECIDVTDELFINGVSQGEVFLGTVCSTGDTNVETLPFTFTYYADAPNECTDTWHDMDNVVSFEANDTDQSGQDEVWIDVTVDCVVGCTLTPGYWMTHSILGPAPFDGAWYDGETQAYLDAVAVAVKVKDLEAGDMPLIYDTDGNPIPGVDGFDTPMAGNWVYVVGKGKDKHEALVTYYYAMWTAPAGNPWFNLSFQFAAAHLNIQNGADYSDIHAEFVAAYELLRDMSPNDADKLRGNDATRAEFIRLAGILSDYNAGLNDVGPGHCDE
jgi:hypothetical protein